MLIMLVILVLIMVYRVAITIILIQYLKDMRKIDKKMAVNFVWNVMAYRRIKKRYSVLKKLYIAALDSDNDNHAIQYRNILRSYRRIISSYRSSIKWYYFNIGK